MATRIYGQKEDDPETINKLNALYTMEYLPALEQVHTVIPRNEGEPVHLHSLRIAKEFDKHEGLSIFMDEANSAGREFIRTAIDDYENDRCHKFFLDTGLDFILNVFQFLLPYSIRPIPSNWSLLFSKLECDTELYSAWTDFLFHFSIDGLQYFKTVSMHSLLIAYSSN